MGMGNYKVYRSDRFDKELSKFETGFQSHVDKIEEQLRENPYLGKPLGVKLFREKRHGTYRIYYVVYEEYASVLMVAISGKKDQQKVINTVRLLLDFFKEELKSIVDKDKLT